MSEKVTLKHFEEIVGTTAELTVMDGPNVDLKVEEVIPASKAEDKGRPKEVRRHQWTVVLSGPEAPQVPDGSYTVTFDKIGPLEYTYVENKSNTPENEKFNTQQKSKAAVGERVIYEIYFG